MKILDIFEKYNRYEKVIVKVYDDEDDEAPFTGTSVWDFPHYLLQEDVELIDTWENEDETGATLIVEVMRRRR